MKIRILHEKVVQRLIVDRASFSIGALRLLLQTGKQGAERSGQILPAVLFGGIGADTEGALFVSHIVGRQRTIHFFFIVIIDHYAPSGLLKDSCRVAIGRPNGQYGAFGGQVFEKFTWYDTHNVGRII